VEKCIFLSLDSSKGDDKSTKGNGKRPFVQDSNGEANLAITKGSVHVLMSLPIWLLLFFLSEPILFKQGLGIDIELYLSLLAHLQVQG
jgi:hypothetical protein